MSDRQTITIQHIGPMEKLLVPALDAAKMLSMGRSTFWRGVAKGTVPAPVKIGGLTRWRVEDLRQFSRLGNVAGHG